VKEKVLKNKCVLNLLWITRLYEVANLEKDFVIARSQNVAVAISRWREVEIAAVIFLL